MRTIPAIMTCCISFAFGLAAAELAASKTEQFECATKTCKQIASCEEAMFLLTECGMKKLDRDGDGIPCESLCKKGATKPMKQTKAEQRKQMIEEILNDLAASLDKIQTHYPSADETERAQDEAFKKELLNEARLILNEKLNED